MRELGICHNYGDYPQSGTTGGNAMSPAWCASTLCLSVFWRYRNFIGFIFKAGPWPNN